VNLPECSPHAARIPQIRFDSAASSSEEALAYWRDSLSRSWELSLNEPAMEKAFYAQSQTWHLDRMLFSTGTFGPMQVRSRREKNIRSDHLDHYRLILLRNGSFDCDAEGRRTQLEPGRFVITDMARSEINVSCSTSIALFIPRDQLDDVLPGQMDIHGLSPDNACARMLTDHLCALADRLPASRIDEVPVLSKATVNLVGASIVATRQNLEAARVAVEHVLLRRARRFVEQHLQDENLGAPEICMHLKVGRSTLYRLFETLGGVSQYIKERRLARIHDLLSTGDRSMSIACLAEQHGFRSAAHFSKAFRAQYGYSAREVSQGNGTPRQEKSASDRLDRWLGALMH
jgi:AraC-like DNA-binding protein